MVIEAEDTRSLDVCGLGKRNLRKMHNLAERTWEIGKYNANWNFINAATQGLLRGIVESYWTLENIVDGAVKQDTSECMPAPII